MALTPQHLRNAPIEEAMISFDFATGVELEWLRKEFEGRIRPDYPSQNDIQEAQFTLNPQGTSRVGESRAVGSRLTSIDGKHVCVINKNTFICSRLKPYEDWEELKREFMRLWGVFSSLADMQVRKVAVRYINKISIPEGSEIYDYINTFPKIAEGLPKDTFNVWVRVMMKIPQPEGILIATEAQLPVEKPGFIPFVLDHDLQFPVLETGPTPDDILQQARELKNQYFFASLSEQLVQEYL